ncbi:MAG: hypothetical protein KDA05_12365 [Phycisphaerales bacterium]|nr:hypothetical protein [Phycisphaerales bacterium]
MTKAASNAKAAKAPAKKRGAKAVAAPTQTETIQANRRRASSEERVQRIAAMTLVEKAVTQCKPGMGRGAASGLWTELGEHKIRQAAQWYLVDHWPVWKIHAKLELPTSKGRQLGRLMDKIQAAYTVECVRDAEKRAAAERSAPLTGDVGGKADLLLERGFDMFTASLDQMEWEKLTLGQQNATLRMLELAADARKIAADSKHKEAQTDRLERMLLREFEEATKQGKTKLDGAVVYDLLAEHMGVKRPAPAGGAA